MQSVTSSSFLLRHIIAWGELPTRKQHRFYTISMYLIIVFTYLHKLRVTCTYTPLKQAFEENSWPLHMNYLSIYMFHVILSTELSTKMV